MEEFHLDVDSNHVDAYLIYLDAEVFQIGLFIVNWV